MAFDFQKFFRDYGAAFDNPEELASFYGSCALVSAPNFMECMKGKAEVLEAMRLTSAYREKKLLQSMEPISINILELDSLHRLAKVQWKMKFEHEATFASSYILREDPHKVSILLHFAHEEEMRSGLDLTIALSD